MVATPLPGGDASCIHRPFYSFAPPSGGGGFGGPPPILSKNCGVPGSPGP
jgi:hypothetical protein